MGQNFVQISPYTPSNSLFFVVGPFQFYHSYSVSNTFGLKYFVLVKNHALCILIAVSYYIS